MASINESQEIPSQDELTTDLSSEKDDGEWMALMGTELQLKILPDILPSEPFPAWMPRRDDDSEPKQTADVGDAVLVDFVGKFAQSDGSDVVFQEARHWLVILGDGDVTPGLEMGIRFLRQLNQPGSVKCYSKYAYGPTGRNASQQNIEVPPDTCVIYQVIVRAVVDSTSEQFHTPQFCMERAKHKKQMGNDVYQYEWDNRYGAMGGQGKNKALKLYGSAVQILTTLINEMQQAAANSEQRETETQESLKTGISEAMALLVDCLNNIAALHLRAKSYGLAKESAANALKYDSNNCKALFRAAKAAMLDPASSFEESDAALCAAEEVEPTNKDLQKLRIEFDRRRRTHYQNEKKLYSKMLPKKTKNILKKDAIEIHKKQELGDEYITEHISAPEGQTMNRETDVLNQSDSPSADENDSKQSEWGTFFIALIVCLLLSGISVRLIFKLNQAGHIQSSDAEHIILQEESEF